MPRNCRIYCTRILFIHGKAVILKKMLCLPVNTHGTEVQNRIVKGSNSGSEGTCNRQPLIPVQQEGFVTHTL